MTDRLTKYQLEFLQEVEKGSPEGELPGPVDFDQLLERLSWKPTKASAHFSVRALIKRGLIKKTEELMLRRGRQRVGFELTPAGHQVLDPRGGTPEATAGAPKAHVAAEAEDLLPGVDVPDLSLDEVANLSIHESFEVG